MIIDNKIEQTFTGPLTIMGISFLIVSISLVFTGIWYVAIPVFIIAMFFLFTWSGILIDIENRRFKPYYMVFGLFKRGQWISLEKYLGLTLVPMQKVYEMTSQSNRKSKSVSNDFRVYLVDQHKRPAYAFKKCKNAEDGKNSMDEFSIWLKLPVYSVRKN
jgi:hypothetical protein